MNMSLAWEKKGCINVLWFVIIVLNYNIFTEAVLLLLCCFLAKLKSWRFSQIIGLFFFFFMGIPYNKGTNCRHVKKHSILTKIANYT